MITYADLAAEALQRWQGIDPARLGRAIEIVDHRTMIYNSRCERGQYDVRSQSGNGWYHVAGHSCTCRDSAAGHVCKHRLAVWLYTEQIRRSIGRTPELIRELGY